MENNSLDRSEEIIVEKSNMDYNSGPVTELGLSLRSTNNFAQPEQNTDSDAGANAGSREDMFVTTNPISELVWSPHKGLSLKCTDGNLADKKAFLWGMVLSSPQSITVGEKNDDGLLVKGNLDCQDPDNVTSLCQSTHNDHKQGSGEDWNESTKKEEQPALNTRHEDDQSDKKGKRICSSADLQSTETSRARRKTISSSPEKASVPEMKEEKLHSLQVYPETGDSVKGTSSDPLEGKRNVGSGNHHTAGTDSESTYETSTSKQCKRPQTSIQILTSACQDHEGLALVIHGVKTLTPSDFLLEKRDSSENDFEPLKGESVSVELAVTSHCADDINRNECHNGVLPKDECALVEASPHNSRILLYQENYTEKVLSNAEFDVGIQKNDDGSHESVESCNNSTGLIKAGKRPWTFDQDLEIGNTKMKQTYERTHCTSVQKHGSSFMNWISNMVKGSSKTELREPTSLDLVTRPSRHEHESDDQLLVLQEQNRPSVCTNTGFRRVFQALHRSGMNVPDTGISNIDRLGIELELDNKTCDKSSKPIVHGAENAQLCKDHTIGALCGDGGGPSSIPIISAASVSVVQEDHKNGSFRTNNLLNIPCDLGNGEVSSSLQNVLHSSTEEKETQKHGFSAPKNSSDSVINRSQPLGSLWITRFYPKMIAPVIDSSQCEKNVGTAVEGSTDCTRTFSPQKCVDSVKKQKSCEDSQEPSTDDRCNVRNKKVQKRVVSTSVSFGPIKDENTDQEFKSRIDSDQPSKRFINSEAMASVFARRLDVLRHIMPSEVDGNTGHATTTCIFCGIRGHKLQECSEITESELDALLKNIDSYDGAEESSCLCIRCFQLDHWAIACPSISSRKRSHSDDNSSLLDFRKFGKKRLHPMNDRATNNERILSDNLVCGGTVALTVSDGQKSRAHTKFKAGTETSRAIVICNKSDSDSKLIKKDHPGISLIEGKSLKNTSREFIVHNGKQTKTSSTTENLSKEYQITAFYNFVDKQIPTIPRGTFEAIKKLRLSRAEIFKWRKSPLLPFPLEGFYVRLRLRKWEKELGSTGYYVARINGGLREKSSGSIKGLLSVKIGGLKCLLESRFVSNHDFLEDELLAWWCATLKGGGNLPSEKDLEMKLKERETFGF